MGKKTKGGTVKGEEVGERKGNGRKKGEEIEGVVNWERWYPTFWYKVTPMSASDIHTKYKFSGKVVNAPPGRVHPPRQSKSPIF